MHTRQTLGTKLAHTHGLGMKGRGVTKILKLHN